MPGVSTDSIVWPGSAAARRRAVISISGSSGTSVHVSLRRGHGPVDQRRRRRRSRARAPRELEALVAVSSPSRRRPRRQRVRVGVRGAAARRGGDRARPVLVARPRRGPRRAPARHRHAARRCCSATSTPSSRTPSTGRCSASASSCSARGTRRHEGRRHPRDRRAARVRQAPRALRRSSRCCWCATRSGGRADFGHVERFAGFDACLCFEAGELAGGDEGVVVRRKAAGTIHVTAHGRSAHSGSAPDRGRNALLALASAAQAVAARARSARPGAPDRGADRDALAATRSTSSPAPASCSATCAPTTSTRSSACWTTIPAEVGGRRASTPS